VRVCARGRSLGEGARWMVGEWGAQPEARTRAHPFVFPFSPYAPKLRPTTQCHVGVCFLSNSFLTKVAMSFSIVYLSMACGVGWMESEGVRGWGKACVVGWAGGRRARPSPTFPTLSARRAGPLTAWVPEPTRPVATLSPQLPGGWVKSVTCEARRPRTGGHSTRSPVPKRRALGERGAPPLPSPAPAPHSPPRPAASRPTCRPP
jgi:hypothetical protein